MAKKTPKSKPNSNQLALVIGVSNYPNPEDRLPAVAADVREMAKVLGSKHGVFPDGVSVLIDKQATRDKILSALKTVFGGARADETVFVYLAGHGVEIDGGYFFVAYDTKSQANAVPLVEIKKLFDQTKSQRTFLWLDFCHAGGILARGKRSSDMDAIKRAIGVVSGQGKIIVAACTPAQYAHEDSALGHGLFTHALLRGLRGEARSIHGDVTVPSLYEFIVRQVQHPAQQPVFFGEMSGLIVLMHYPEPNSSNKKTAKAKYPKPKSISGPKAGGMWMMLGDRFFWADSMHHRSDRTVEIVATTSKAEDAALFADFRATQYGSGSDLPFAVNNEAHLLRFKNIESKATDGRQVWTLVFSVEDDRFDNGMSVTYQIGGRTYTQDDIARLRAGRILLNEPQPRTERSGWYNAEESLLSIIEGSGRYAVRECAIKSVFASHRKNPNWKDFARLKAIFLLKATGTVEHIFDLTIGAVRAGRVGVQFRGRRPLRPGCGEATIIELSNFCSLGT